MLLQLCCVMHCFVGKKFTLVDWIACILMSTGLIFFTLADSSVSPSFSLYGNVNSLADGLYFDEVLIWILELIIMYDM